MNSIFKKTLLSTVAAAMCVGSTGCLEEAFPDGGTLLADQISDADKPPFVAAIAGYMTSYSKYIYDTGFSAFGVWWDSMTPDAPCNNNFYDYFPYFAMQTYLGNWELQTMFWSRYYKLLRYCNSVLATSDLTPLSADTEGVGNALVYRSYIFMDLMRLYEYKKTGVASLDQFAESEGIYGLTVPIVTPETTEQDARNNPRVPFWHMYRFIMNDLNLAVKCLAETHTADDKDYASLGVAYGMRARLWLEIGTRFQRHAEDLALQLQNEDNPELAGLDKLAVATAEDCLRNAAKDARAAINEGYTPLTQAQWQDPKNGFNTPNNSWMWAILVNSNNPLASYNTWQSMPSYLSPEASYGVSSSTYGSYRRIDARLYELINPNDWRRDSWIGPEDSGNQEAFESKYAALTNLKFDQWSKYADYTGFKFHPGSGNCDESTQGNVFCTPLMRVEEMYLIEAEATARCMSPAAGMDLLCSFMTNYRMKPGTTFTSRAASLDAVLDEIFTQKRIELWGEGQILWDYRRLEKAIIKGYPGTNHIEMYRFNSYPDHVAPWTTLYIPDYVQEQNQAVKPNPDPSDVLPKWQEKKEE